MEGLGWASGDHIQVRISVQQMVTHEMRIISTYYFNAQPWRKFEHAFALFLTPPFPQKFLAVIRSLERGSYDFPLSS